VRERPRGGEGEAKGRRGYLAARGEEVFEGAQGGGQQGPGGAPHLGHQPTRALLHLEEYRNGRWQTKHNREE